jgi:hypothetical protein
MFLSHKLRYPLIALIVALAAVFVVSCDDDNDDSNPPVTGKLTGTAIFHGDWPDSGAVQLSIFENWNISAGNCSWCVNAAGGPPAYYTHQGYFTDPDPANDNDADTLTFEITGISLGTYNAIVTGWRAPEVNDLACDEPVVGMYGGNPLTGDSLPSAVVFSEASPNQSITIETYFDYFLPVPGCGDRGRIEGTLNLDGDYPDGGLLVMISTFPFNPWQAPMGAPTDYYVMESAADTNFRFEPPFGSYYLSVWSAAPPPAPTYWYGCYGINTQLAGSPLVNDARPDAVVLSEATPVVRDFAVKAFAPRPHWLSGSVTYNGTRPAEGLLVMLSTFPVSPEQPPMGAPTGYFAITNDTENLYAFTGMPAGTYYISLWNNVQGPGATCFGAHGWTAGGSPTPITIDGDANFGQIGINVSN